MKPLFKAEIKHPIYFRNAIKTLARYIDEVTMNFSSTGIQLTTMDPAHIAYLEYKLKDEAIDGEIIEEGFKFSLDMEDMAKKLKFNQYAKLTLECYDTEMYIITKENIKTIRKIQWTDSDDDKIKTPNFEFDTNLFVNAHDLQAAIKNTSTGDYINFNYDPNKSINMLLLTNSTENIKCEVSDYSNVSLLIENKEAESRYSTKYMNDLIKNLPLPDPHFNIRMKSDFPIEITNNSMYSDFKLLIAPRIDSE